MESVSPNQRVYEIAEVVEDYAEADQAMQAEETIVASLLPELEDQPILEVGVGAGRLTPLLQTVTKSYVGADYSQKMIDMCKRKFADGTFVVCDARRMSMFPDESFAAVFFCWNGIDDVSPSDRNLILAEVRRVLRKNGVFVFSAHNLDWKGIPTYFLTHFYWQRNPIAFVRDNVGHFRTFMSAFLAKWGSKLRGSDFVVILEYEDAADLLVPRCYIRKEAQVEQLRDAGFRPIEAFASNGEILNASNRGEDFLVYYVARK